MALQLTQATLVAGMFGLLDDSPYGGAARIKSAGATLRVLERAGRLANLPDPLPPDPGERAKLRDKEKSQRQHEANVKVKPGVVEDESLHQVHGPS